MTIHENLEVVIYAIYGENGRTYMIKVVDIFGFIILGLLVVYLISWIACKLRQHKLIRQDVPLPLIRWLNISILSWRKLCSSSERIFHWLLLPMLMYILPSMNSLVTLTSMVRKQLSFSFNLKLLLGTCMHCTYYKIV